MSLSDRELLERRVVLRPDEVAKILQCSRRTVYRLVEANALETVHAGKRGMRITADSVRAYLGDGVA